MSSERDGTKRAPNAAHVATREVEQVTADRYVRVVEVGVPDATRLQGAEPDEAPLVGIAEIDLRQSPGMLRVHCRPLREAANRPRHSSWCETYRRSDGSNRRTARSSRTSSHSCPTAVSGPGDQAW